VRSRFLLALVGLCAFTLAGADYSFKPRSSAVPKELSKPVAELLGDRAVQLLDANGGVIAEIWLRKEIPAKATAEQVKNGLTLHEIEESMILGAIRFDQPGSDYRQQKIQPGVYTIRLGFQPMDGDHMGTAPHSEFGLLVPAKADAKPDIMTAKELQDLSKKASGSSHPAVFLIYPNEKPADAFTLVDKGNRVWVLNMKLPVTAANQKTAIGIGLTLIGHSEG
jgi:hypothetical protein